MQYGFVPNTPALGFEVANIKSRTKTFVSLFARKMKRNHGDARTKHNGNLKEDF